MSSFFPAVDVFFLPYQLPRILEGYFQDPGEILLSDRVTSIDAERGHAGASDRHKRVVRGDNGSVRLVPAAGRDDLQCVPVRQSVTGAEDAPGSVGEDTAEVCKIVAGAGT